MRVVVAVGMAVSMLVVGITALSESAQQTRDAAVVNGTNSSAMAWNTTTNVVDGLGQAAAPGVVWMGVAAIVLVALGILVSASGGGR